MMHRSIALWGHPRSMSTAIERSFMERGDFVVFHEAFSYVYFMHEERASIPHKHPDPGHPRTYSDVKAMMERARAKRPVFHKDFPYHVIDHLLGDPGYLRSQTNTFLIRDPAEAVPSHASIHPDLTREVLGYAELVQLFDRVADLTGSAPTVLNAADVVANPAATIAGYCSAVGISFMPAALTWPAGDRPEWATWRGWHGDVAASTGFAKPRSTHRIASAETPRLREFVDYCRPFYDYLDRHRLHVLPEAA
jgi:Sulfotransferase domain